MQNTANLVPQSAAEEEVAQYMDGFVKRKVTLDDLLRIESTSGNLDERNAARKMIEMGRTNMAELRRIVREKIRFVDLLRNAQN